MNVLDRDGFRALIASLSGLSDGMTYWWVDPTPMTSDTDRALVRLEVFNMYALGVDEHRRHVSDGTDGYPVNTFWVQEIGNRHITINIRVEAFDRGVEATEIIDLIRTRVRADAVTAQLDAMRLAYVWSEKAIRVPNTADSRALNTATCDFTFAGIANVISDVEVEQGWIEKVNGNNTIPGTFNP